MYQRVNVRKESLKLGSCAKIKTWYCKPFEVLDRIRPIAYKIALPINMIHHKFFHVSFLKKYVHDPNHLVDWNMIQVDLEGEFQVDPIRIIKWEETMRIVPQLWKATQFWGRTTQNLRWVKQRNGKQGRCRVQELDLCGLGHKDYRVQETSPLVSVTGFWDLRSFRPTIL